MAMNWISEQQGVEVRATIIEMVASANAAGVDIHRAVIARELAVTRSTAGKHVDRLIEEGKLREVNGRMLELSSQAKRARTVAAKKKPARKAPARKVAAAR